MINLQEYHLYQIFLI